jgi:hypothetical protein
VQVLLGRCKWLQPNICVFASRSLALHHRNPFVFVICCPRICTLVYVEFPVQASTAKVDWPIVTSVYSENVPDRCESGNCYMMAVLTHTHVHVGRNASMRNKRKDNIACFAGADRTLQTCEERVQEVKTDFLHCSKC